MLLRRLILENYGLFRGRHELDLAPRVKYRERRPIILFGGKNGAGKTTILEAIRLVLYGRLVLGNRVRNVDYTAFLRGRIHRGHGTSVKPQSATIAIEFDHVHRGEPDCYLVERSWRFAGSDDVAETLSVRKNDKLLEEVDAEFWQGFVRDIIPEGLAQLFFFDGEKIRELAEDATGAGVLADSIKSLLGLDFAERLDADLTVYANREVAKLGSAEDREVATQCEAELATIRDMIRAANEELAGIRTRTDGVQAEIRRAEEGLRRDGEDLARRRQRIHEEGTQLKVKIEGAERALRDLCEGLLPLALCPATARLLRQQLSSEKVLSHAGHIKSALNRTKEDLLKALTSHETRRAGVTAPATKAIKERIELVFADRLAAVCPSAGFKPIHNLSESDQRRVGQWLASAQSHIRNEAQRLGKDLVRWHDRLESVERRVAQSPSDEAVAPQIQALTELGRRLGAIEQSRTEIEGRLYRLKLDQEQKERELRRLTDRYAGRVESGNRITIAKNVQKALGVYLRRLTDLKVRQLQEAIVTCFNRLCRKGDVVHRIAIDPNTFGVTLYDGSAVPVPKEELSSGEKQIFAIAMLWGLAQTSGRPLPVIIDTPLGRLDSEHRRKLIHEYFPHASHQVLLLSTDTEVDQSLFAELSPAVSHSYQLIYQGNESRTEVVEGYFWRKKEEQSCLT